MLIRKAIEHYGSQTKLAAALELTQPAVAAWLKRGKKAVPKRHARRLHQLTRGKLLFRETDYATP